MKNASDTLILSELLSWGLLKVNSHPNGRLVTILQKQAEPIFTSKSTNYPESHTFLNSHWKQVFMYGQ